MAHTNVQLVSGNLTTGGDDPTFFIDRVNNKIGIGDVPVITGVEAVPATSNVLQVTGSMLATKYHGDGSSLTGLNDSKWLEYSGDTTKIYYNGGNVGVGTTDPDAKLHVNGNVDNVGISIQNNARKYTVGVRGDTSDVFSIVDDTAGAFRAVIDSSGNVGIGTAVPQASLHVNGNKAIINGQSSVQTVNVYKTAGGNSGAQTVRYYRVYVPNGYTNFQIIFRGFGRNNGGGGDIQAWRRQYTVQRNSGSGVTITHNSGENINATGFTFNTSQTGGVTDTIEIHFDVTFPPQPNYATYITFKADVIGDSGSFANTSGI